MPQQITIPHAKWILRLPLTFIVLAVLIISEGQAEVSCAVAESALTQAGRIRGLNLKREVPCALHSREEIKAFIVNALTTKVPKGRMALEELTYKAVGLIPQSFEYEKKLVELYLSQIGGYYDPEKKRYIMAAWMPEMMQPVIAVHELTHALQDQHFNLEDFLSIERYKSDELLARSALVEGDATAVMTDYTRELSGDKPLQASEGVEGLMAQQLLSLSLSMSVSEVPESLKFQLLFPYTSGLRFAHALLRQGGYQKLSQAFLSPPQSTEQILHPEKYQVESPVEIPSSSFRLPKGATIVHRDTLGEFLISLALAQHLTSRDEAVAAAAGWAGDLLIVAKQGDEYVVKWRTVWDTIQDQKEFDQAIRKTFTQRGISIRTQIAVPSEALQNGSESASIEVSDASHSVEIEFPMLRLKL